MPAEQAATCGVPGSPWCPMMQGRLHLPSQALLEKAAENDLVPPSSMYGTTFLLNKADMACMSALQLSDHSWQEQLLR